MHSGHRVQLAGERPVTQKPRARGRKGVGSQIVSGSVKQHLYRLNRRLVRMSQALSEYLPFKNAKVSFKDVLFFPFLSFAFFIPYST